MSVERWDGEGWSDACAHLRTRTELDHVGQARVTAGLDPCKPWKFGSAAMWLCAHRKTCRDCGAVVAYSLGPKCPRVPAWRTGQQGTALRT